VIDRLQIAYDIPVIFTENVKSTVDYLNGRYMYMKDLSDFFRVSHNTIKDQLIRPKLKNQDLKDPSIFLINTLCMIPRMSYEMASAIVSVIPEENRSIKGCIDFFATMDNSIQVTYRSSHSNKEHKITKNMFTRLQQILGIITDS
jgi:hypothetical protein